MTLKQFIQSLPPEGWELSPLGRIRRRYPEASCCPIEHFFGFKPHRWCTTMITKKGYLNERQIYVIISAADNWCYTPTETRIRRALLKQCGLSHEPVHRREPDAQGTL